MSNQTTGAITTNAVTTTTAQTPINQAVAMLETAAFKQQLTQLLPAHVKTEQFLSVARRGIVGNKALNFSTMNKNTLYASVLKAAEQGMKLDGEEAALVQYGDSVQFMKMIKGVKKQLRNSGEIKEITAEVVYENDKFEYWVDDDGKHIKHMPMLTSKRGELVAAYSIITTKDGGRYIKVMSKEEIEVVQGASKTGKAQFSPWNGPFKSEMWCKTVLRRNAKDCPTSTDLPEVFKEWDEDFDFSNGGGANSGGGNNSNGNSQQRANENKSPDNSNQNAGSGKSPRRKTKIDELLEKENSAKAQEPSDLIDVSNEKNGQDVADDDELPI